MIVADRTGRAAAVPKTMPRIPPWWRALGGIALAGLALRLVYVVFFRSWALAELGDAWYFHSAANLLVDGKGFIQPIVLVLQGSHNQSAAHPPGYILALAVPSLVGLRTVLDHMLFSSLLGTTTIVVTGCIGRRVAGDPVGLIAAAVAAFAPNLWVTDGLVMSETLTILLTGVVILCAYRIWSQPNYARVATFGIALGALILTRAEAALLIPCLVIPLAFYMQSASWRRGLVIGGVTIATALTTVAPWTIFNATRFDHTVLVSDSMGFTMMVANCAVTYEGPQIGYWSFICPKAGAAESVPAEQDLVQRRQALKYMGDHLGRLPAVIAAREGRTFSFFRPLQQLRFDSTETNRPFGASFVGLLVYYALLPFAVAGAFVLRRRKVTLLPLLVPIGVVVLTTAFIYGQTRFRAMAEVPIVVLAAVALGRLGADTT